MRVFVLMGAALLLLAGVSAAFFFNAKVGVARGPHLTRYLPDRLEGWTVRDESLGATELESRAAKETLRFDDYIYRSYSRPEMSFSIYVAYWAPGKPARGLAGGHTPDTCWPLAGCEILDRRSEMEIGNRGRAWPTAEWRRFRMPGGDITEVLFWHVAGDRVLHFDRHSPLNWLRDALREIGVARREQYFVRIVSAQPIISVLRDPGFKQATERLGALVFPDGVVDEH